MFELFLGFTIPFLGTTLGAGLVFFSTNHINKNTHSLITGFSAGIMLAASIWSLLIPAINNSAHLNQLSWIPASIGLLAGFLFLFSIDKIVPDKQNNLMFLAINIHNIPEGMAVGVALASVFCNSSTTASAITLAIGIAIQNFPEGSIISLPLHSSGLSKSKSFLQGIYSASIEPIAAVVTFFISSLISNIFPYILSFAAGTMIYVVINEVLPESQTNKKLSTIGFFTGFLVMMILDVMLS